MKRLHRSQQGWSLSEIIVWVVLIVAGGIMAMKLVPAYTEADTIERHLQVITNDPKMRNASKHELKMAFVKRSAIDNIKSVSPDELVIQKGSKKSPPVISASYEVELPVAGNVFLLVKFDVSSVNDEEE